jgi:hypothetical protein
MDPVNLTHQFLTAPDGASLAAPGVRAISAGTNRSYTNNQTAPAGTTHAMVQNFAACQMTSRASGVFRFGFSVVWGGAAPPANGDLLAFVITTQTSVAPIVLAGGTPTGANGTASNGWQVNTVAGTGITVSSGGGGTLTQAGGQTFNALTGMLRGEWAVSGILRNSVTGAVETPFSTNMVILFSLNESATDNITLNPINAWCEEEV